ncbi:MAG TPA: hypothetical protein VKY38_09220 [Azoarcus sp.]|nr:hypothetical protein [Azoarcus sp.]
MLAAVLMVPGMAAEKEVVELCFNYGCARSELISFSAEELAGVHAYLSDAENAAAERAALAKAVALMYRLAGSQTPISADQAGNLADEGVHGRMDCIDHSTNTNAFLRIIEKRGWLRFHEVDAVAQRKWLIFSQHFSAAVRTHAGQGWVIDSWFVEHGEPAVVLPLEKWMKGDGPNVY